MNKSYKYLPDHIPVECLAAPEVYQQVDEIFSDSPNPDVLVATLSCCYNILDVFIEHSRDFGGTKLEILYLEQTHYHTWEALKYLLPDLGLKIKERLALAKQNRENRAIDRMMRL